LEIERLKVHKATTHERLYQAQRYEQELQKLKDEISIRLPLLAAAAVKRAQEAAAAAAAAAVVVREKEEEEGEEEKEEEGEEECEHLIKPLPVRMLPLPRRPLAGEGGGSNSAALTRRRGGASSSSSSSGGGKGTLAMRLLQEWRRENQALRMEIAELRTACYYQVPLPSSSASFSSASSSPPPFYVTASPARPIAAATAAAAAAAAATPGVGAAAKAMSSSSSSSVRGVDLEAWRRKYSRPAARGWEEEGEGEGLEDVLE